MRRFTLLLALSTLVLVPLSAGPAKPPTGFRDVRWGDPPLRDMRMTEGRPAEEAVYERLSDSLTFAGVKADSIHYLYWHNRLYSVLIRGRAGFKNVRDNLKSEWGEAFRAKPDLESYTWSSEEREQHTIAGLDPYRENGFAVAIFSVDIAATMDVDKARDVARAASVD